MSNKFRLPKPHRDHLQSVYNAHMLHSVTADPFKLALYKLMGKLDEAEDGGLRTLAEVLLGYGQCRFDGPPNQPGLRKGVWAGVLLMCGQFERVSSLISPNLMSISHWTCRP